MCWWLRGCMQRMKRSGNFFKNVLVQNKKILTLDDQDGWIKDDIEAHLLKMRLKEILVMKYLKLQIKFIIEAHVLKVQIKETLNLKLQSKGILSVLVLRV